MKSRSLQSKLFFAYISLACLILFSFAVFFYAFVSRQLKQSQISAMNTLNSSFQTQVDSAIRNLDAVSVNINYSNQSKTILDNSFNLNISSNMLSAMSDLFISLSGTELKADQVNQLWSKRRMAQRMSGLRSPVNWREKKSLLHPTVPENIQKQPPMTSGLFPCTDPLIININVAWV